MAVALATQALPTTPTLLPPLKWAGGKRWLVPRLQPLWQRYGGQRLVEPFCGGLAIALGLHPQRALLNDINPHNINFYQWLQRGLQIDLPLDNSSECYYEYRRCFNRLVTGEGLYSQEAASLFYYLNRTGYNGLCRFNRKGEFNVPFGRYKRINYAQDFRHYQPLLSSWVFSARDFAALDLANTDFIYADPPYDVEFRQYCKVGFAWADQVRLAHWLAQHSGPVVASNQATPRILELYESLAFEIQIVHGPRMISCNGDRTPAREILASRNLD
ncbi:MAG: Dam family site-specific DNA-(adenine-N6)-methyltransferase [Cyanobacteria bacterium P01_H01_bin.121]